MNIAELNKKFETADPHAILRWAVATYGQKAALSSSFGSQAAVLLHMISEIDPTVPVLFLDTGFLFKETIQYKDDLKKRLHLNIKEFRATPEQIAAVKKKLADPDNKAGLCCDDTKVDLMKRSLEGVACWIAGLRRKQSATRKNIDIIEDYGSGLIKVHPIANWTSKDVYDYMKKHDLPFHPLWEKGYTSIGCEPCTSLPVAGQDERSGRWAGQEKTECGIHTFLAKDKK
jgi:phosphoadenosine phosphosulfate reductase